MRKEVYNWKRLWAFFHMEFPRIDTLEMRLFRELQALFLQKLRRNSTLLEAN